MLALITFVVVVPGDAGADAVVPRRVGPHATARCATASPRCSPTSPRASPASASSPPTTGAATTSSTTATSSARYRDANVDTARVGGIYGSATEAVGVVAQALLLLVGGRMVLDGELIDRRADRLHRCTSARSSPRSSSWSSSTHLPAGPGGGGEAARPARRPSRRCPSSPARVDLPPVEGEIRLEGVSLRLRPGQPDGAARRRPHDRRRARPSPSSGPTGAGKSTIAKLVTRFYDPTAGRVLHRRPRPARRDPRVAAPPARRRAPGAVPVQRHDARQPRLRPARRHRRRGGRGRAGPSASTTSSTRLPDGLDTLVHERGSSLSSGERQLLALGRAFLARPRVLVLDEATSNLDLRSEAQGRAGPRRAARGPHRHRHRPPPRHRHAGRPHRRRRRGPHRRARLATTSSSPSAAATPRCSRPGSPTAAPPRPAS